MSPEYMIFALQPGGRPGIILIGADGQARRFASLPATLTPTGITFDATGHFGYKLLVTASSHAETTVLAIDCAGGVRAITSQARPWRAASRWRPRRSAVTAATSSPLGETSGHVFAIGPDGSVVTLVVSGLPHGGDIGVESAGFAPPGFGLGGAAYLADRFSKGNRHPGTDSILRLPHGCLAGSGCGLSPASRNARPKLMTEAK